MRRNHGSPNGYEDALLDVAARWFLRAQENGGPEFEAELAAWLDADPEHERAYQAVSGAWTAVGDLGSTSELISLRRAALRTASHARTGVWRRVSPARAPAIWAVAAVLLLFVGGLTTFALVHAPGPLVFETARGERRTLTLADGSVVLLDESSRVSVNYRRRFRDLALMTGQAEFKVATDPLRPFTVSAADRRVVATGTVFNVDLLGDQLIVTLLKGGVVVAPEQSRQGQVETISLKPSERLVVDRDSGVGTKQTVDAEDMAAWTLGKLIFDAEPLDQAVARVNRYSRRRIILTAAGQAQARISGVFNAGDADAFAEAVSAQLPLRLQPRPDVIVLSPR